MSIYDKEEQLHIENHNHLDFNALTHVYIQVESLFFISGHC